MRLVKLFALLCAVTLRGADPAEELKSFQIADGFEANLFASEADGLIKPIQIRFDTRGRLWVIGTTVYPQLEPGQKPNDKVLILEDNNHDGRVDQVKTFADGLMIPTGLELTRDGAYVGHGPELLLLRDTDGDDRADERTVVLRGFGTGDNHQNINSFTWGPGGELWMCQGLHIVSNVETPHGPVFMQKAGIWRFRPHILKLEPFYGSEHEPQNPWGHVFNEKNEHIVLAGNNSSPIFPDAGLVPNRRDDPPPLIWPNGNGRKVSGGDFVANAHFPEDWQGRLILGGYINNAVWSANVVEDGAGFRFEDGPPLIRSTAREFRPVDVKFGPDGTLFLCDWYNPIIGHYQASFRHPDRDKTHGRIWRVTAKNRALSQQARIHKASPDELFANLQSKDRWTRQQTIRELANRRASEVMPLLNEWAARNPGDQVAMHLLGLYQAHETPAPDLLARLCKSRDPHIRAYAASAVGTMNGAPELLRPLVADEHPRVRLEALIACAQLNNAEAIEIALIAADHPSDRFLTYALNQTVHSLKAQWLPRFQAGALNLPEGRLAALVRADASADTLQGLRKFISRPAFRQLLAENGSAEDIHSILSLPEVEPKIFQAISARKITPTEKLNSALRSHLKTDEALALAGQWRVELAAIRAIARDAQEPLPRRRAAIQGLSRAGESEILRDLSVSGPEQIRAAAVSAWQVIDAKAAAIAAAEILNESTAAEIITAFLQRPASTAALAEAIGNRKLPPETSRVALAALSSSGRRSEELARAISQTTAKEKSANFAGGDSKRGRQVYERAELGCVTCHKINGAGGSIGPDLSALGTAQPIDFIARAILDPQKEIKEGFSSVSIATKSGDEFQGYIVRETGNEILLRDPLLNEEIKISRTDIVKQKPNGSLMPNGLVDQLSDVEFRDLVAYLSTLGKP